MIVTVEPSCAPVDTVRGWGDALLEEVGSFKGNLIIYYFMKRYFTEKYSSNSSERKKMFLSKYLLFMYSQFFIKFVIVMTSIIKIP